MLKNTTSNNAISHLSQTRIFILSELYKPCIETAIPTIYRVLNLFNDSTISPSLSDIELADLEIAETEFARDIPEVFEDAESFLESLHALRRQNQENLE